MGRGLLGTVAMARGAPDWRARLPTDEEAVSGSFWAIALAVPAVALAAETSRRAALATPEAMPGVPLGDPLGFAVLNLGVMIVSWLAGLAVLSRLAAQQGGARSANTVIVGYNWARLMAHLAGGVGAALVVLTDASFLLGLSSFVALGLSVWLDLGVIRRALDVPMGRAVGAYAFVLLSRLAAGMLVALLGALLLR